MNCAGSASLHLHPLYDQCGCIYPCPDHKSPAQDGKRDEEYWSAKESEPVAEND